MVCNKLPTTHFILLYYSVSTVPKGSFTTLTATSKIPFNVLSCFSKSEILVLSNYYNVTLFNLFQQGKQSYIFKLLKN